MVEDTNNKLINYRCNSCGKSFSTTDKNLISNCIFCNDSNLDVVDSNIDDTRKIMPFTKTSEDVIKSYKRKIINPLIPVIFKNSIDSIKKLYLPVNLTNINVSGDIEFLCGEKKDTNRYSVIQNTNINYNNVVFLESDLIDYNEFIEICDYDFFKIENMNIDYFNDSFYVNNNLNNEEERIRKNVIKNCKSSINHTLKKVEKDNTSITYNGSEKILVPIYMLDIKYKDKDYKYIYNGNTGSDYINIPISKTKVIIFSIILFIIIFVLSFLLAYFL